MPPPFLMSLPRRTLIGASVGVLFRKSRADEGLLLGVPNSAYTGPGDIFPGAVFYGAIQPYNRANFNAAHVVNLQRSSDSATSDFGYTNGLLNQLAIAAWGGVNATGAGSIVPNGSFGTLTFTGGVIGGQVTGAGVLPGTIITGGSSPTWQVNFSQTVASTTITVANALSVLKLYDQTGNVTVGVAPNPPALALNALGTSGLPAIASTSNTSRLPVTLASQLSMPFTISGVALIHGTAIFGGMLGDVTGNRTSLAHSTTNTIQMGSSGNVTGTATDGAAFAGVYYYSTSTGAAIMNLNGTETTGTENFSALGASIYLFNEGQSSLPATGNYGGYGIWPGSAGTPSAATRAALVTNMRNWAGF